MGMINRLITLLTVLLTLAGKAIASADAPVAPVDAKTVAAEIAMAESTRQRAAAAGAEWLQTGSLVEQARQAAENENWHLALTLARQAREQSELAVQQSQRESEAWRNRVVR
jgi:histidyl-tRNA synthetase